MAQSHKAMQILGKRRIIKVEQEDHVQLKQCSLLQMSGMLRGVFDNEATGVHFGKASKI